jgi:CheY-like chemotaxis protein
MRERHVRFLLVDNDDRRAELVMRSLNSACATSDVFRVQDGAAAMAALRQEGDFSHVTRPDVVLLDLALPNGDGHDVLMAIKGDQELKLIPVVVLAQSGAESDRQQAYEQCANSYVVKPDDVERFREMLENVSRYWGVWNESPFCD